MKTLTKYLNEKLVINKYYNDPYTCVPTSWKELRKIIEDRYDKLGPGTKQNPIDFNDVDVSNIDSFYNKHYEIGIFEKTKFEYIDILYWNVSNIKDMGYMFFGCEQLKSIGDISNWDVSRVENMRYMFQGCAQLKSVDLSNWNVSKVENMDSIFSDCYHLKSVGDLSNWNVSNAENISSIFFKCKQLKSVGDLSNWNVSKVENINSMFASCEQLKSVGNLSNWNVSNVKYMSSMFYNSGITNKPKWYKQ